MPAVHDDVTITSWWCHPWHAYCACWHHIMSCWRHSLPGQPCGSGRLVFGSGQLIRVKKTRVTRGARLCAWVVTSPAREGVFDVRFRRGFQQWLCIFLLYTVVWSKHNFDNFYFWAKSNTPLNHVLWYQLLGIPAGDVLIFAQRRVSTLTQYFTWFGKLPTSTRESPYYLEIEKGYNKYMEEDHSTPFHTLCCIWQQLLFLSSSRHFTLTHSAAYGSRGSSPSFSLLLVTSLSHTLSLHSQI
jgi:hypothetical protein